jgi:hypothetical protein
MRRLLGLAAAAVLVAALVLVLTGDPGLECGRSGEFQGIDCLDSFPSSARFGAEPAASLGWEILFGAIAVAALTLCYLLVSGITRERRLRRLESGR